MCEEEGGVVPAWHLDPLGPVRLAVWDVIGEEVGPAEDVQAVDAREADSIVPGSWGDEAAQVFHQDVVPLLLVGQQEQVHVWSVAKLGQAERVDDGVLVAEDVDRHRVLGLEAPDVTGGDGERDAGHVELRLEVGVVGETLRVATGGATGGATGWRPARTAHTKHLLSSLWTLTMALRAASFEGVGRYDAPYRGWYAAMWMVMSKTASNVHPDPSAM